MSSSERVGPIRHQEHLRPPAQGLQFERFFPLRSRIIDASYLDQFGLPSDYDFRKKLGPSVLYEATEKESATAAEDIAKALVGGTGQTPDIVIVSTSHLPPFKLGNPNQQRRANQVRESLTGLVLKTSLAPATPDNTQTVSTACSGFVVALDWLRRINPQGQNVLMVMDETGYRRTLPPPEEDNTKSGLIFSDRAIAMQFTYGTDLDVLATIIQHEKDIGAFLRMKTPDYDKSDPFLTVIRPPYADRFEMIGPELKRYFVRKISKITIQELLDPQIDVELTNFVLHHQASVRMVDGFETLGIANARYYGRGILEYGNTSSASIPFDLQDGLTNGNIQKGNTGLLIAYGAGLTWAAAMVRL